MKRKLLYISIILSVFTLSCSDDFITSDLNGKQDLDNYFVTQSECESFINGLYPGFAYWHDWWQNHLRLTNEMATDDAWMGNLGQDASENYPFAFYTITASNAPDALINFYYFKYQNIGSANIAIQRIPNSPIPQADKDKFIGQAHFFRAFSYWELVQNFGDVVLTLEPIGSDDLNVGRTPKAQVYNAIVADLKMAAQLLPEKWDGANTGRATSWAAKALLARTYLFMADYTNAYAYADSVIKYGPYQLEPDFVNVWSCYNHNGIESIFEIQTSSEQSFSIGNRISVVVNARSEIWATDETDKTMDGWGWCVPTSNLENAYKEEADSIRLKSTIIRLGQPVYGDSLDNPAYMFNPDHNKSCRTWRKMYVPIAVRKSLIAKDSHIPLNMILIRLAEMYLTRAEAAYFLNNQTQALADINTLRQRVKLNDKKDLSGNNLLYAIWKERRLELAGEGLRLFDIRRQIDPVTKKSMVATLMGPNGTFVKYNQNSTDYWENLHTKEPSDKGSAFIEGRHELWPIPQAEIDKSKSISQNSGY